MKVAADTGALISLKLSGILEKSLDFFVYLIGEKIKEELEQIAATPDELGEAARDILSLIGRGVEIVKTSGHEEGEYEALEILNRIADILISDDIKFVKAQRDERISFSTFVLFFLYKKGIFDKREILRTLDSIFKKRKWAENLIYVTAKGLIEKE